MQSHPSWVRGLKLAAFRYSTRAKQSHPSWVRGLKRLYKVIGALVLPVAPLVGAWIETDEEYEKRKREKSHPSWVRGLKLY